MGRKTKPTVYTTAFASYARGAVLGQGGNGTVLSVTDENGKQFALKILDPARVTSERRKRFKNEIAFCATDRHPNIIRVLDHGAYEGKTGLTTFYLMPIYEKTLRQLMDEGRDKEQLLDVLIRVAKGVEVAHREGHFHRDLKPQNILASTDLSEVVVADWGIAHFSADEIHTLVETRPGERLANFEYAAPEQCSKGTRVDHRADIYAIGLMMNEVFTGSVPRGAKHSRIIDASPEHGFLDDLVDRMISQRPDDRPSSLDKVLGEMKVLLETEASRRLLQKLERVRIEADPEYDPLLEGAVELAPGGLDRPRPGQFTFKLTQPVTPHWAMSFKRLQTHRAIVDRRGRPLDPHVCSFQADVLTVEFDEENVARVVPEVKGLLMSGNQQYRDDVQRRRQTEREKREQEIRSRIEDEKRRQTIVEHGNKLI